VTQPPASATPRAEILWRVQRFALLPSTNDVALAAIEQGTARAGDVYLAERQTAGRGQPGRQWRANDGALLFSAILPTQEPIAAASLAAGVAVATALRDLAYPAQLKWPNDVLLAGRKVAGILAEARGGLVVVGIGINANNRVADEVGFRTPAISLAEHAGRPVDREALLQAILRALAATWAAWTRGGFAAIRPRWEPLDACRGRRVAIGAGVTGIACGIGADGSLRVQLDDGTWHHAVTGEVTFLQESTDGCE